uniref:Translin-associated protein X n=1 Tax=Plectus sambesii TaxID=2011161 RepID=A0A914WT32_9BILA
MTSRSKKNEDGDNSEEVETLKSEEVRGLPKSGRWWKDPKKERHSAIIKVKPLKSTWKKKMQQKAVMKATMDLQTEIREKRKAEKEAKKEARLEQEKRREENIKKAEIVQFMMSDHPRRGGGGGGRGRGGGARHNNRDSSSLAYGNQSLNPADERQLKEAAERMAAIPDTDRNLFLDYQAELDDKHDRYERIVKVSRDITISSKRIIFLLHRITTAKTDAEKVAILAEASERLIAVRENLFFVVAKELEDLDQNQYNRAITAGIQEYIEVCSFEMFLRCRKLINRDEIQADLVFILPEDHPENPGKRVSVQVSVADYLCGIGDLGGELMRFAINSISAGDFSAPIDVADFLRGMYRGCLFIGNSWGSKEFGQKTRVLKQSTMKVEAALYELNVRRSEVPEHMKHMLADFIASRAHSYAAGQPDEDPDIGAGHF